MFGGPVTALVPAAVLVGVLVWLSVEERASVTGFWVGGWAALVAGVLLTRTPRAYADSAIRGLSDKTGAVIVTAFLFAGVFGKLLAGAGLVEGLLWVGLESGLEGAMFTVLAFVLACLFGAGTGTSLGTVVAMVPVLYPTGIFLGADPAWLAVAVLAGGAFGDNIGPISDTTISSAYTQKAEMGDVVRTRLPLALAAAGISIVVLAIFGGGCETVARQAQSDATPVGLLLAIPFVLVIWLSLRRVHIIISLTWGSLATIALGLATGMMAPGDVFSIPEERGTSTGLIEDGIAGVTGAVVLVLFILAMAQILADSGLMDRILAKLEVQAAKGVRSAELMIVGVSLLFSIPLGANTPAILLVGPTLARPLGLRNNLAPARTANLLDCSVCTLFYMLPWHNAVIVWYATVLAVATQYDIAAPSLASALLNPYAWALLAVLFFSVITGWNRKYATAPDPTPTS